MRSYQAITVWQPWASLIAIGAKPYEFRRYPPPASYVGTRIAIHAGARPMRRAEVAELLAQLGADRGHLTREQQDRSVELLREVLHKLGVSGPPALPSSAVLCTAELGQAVRGLGRNDSDRDEHAIYAWPLREVTALPGPHPYVRGLQGWWRWWDGQ